MSNNTRLSIENAVCAMSFRSCFTRYGTRRQLIIKSPEKEMIRFSSLRLLKILLCFFGVIFCLGCILDVRTTNIIYNYNKKIENSLPIQEIVKPEYPTYSVQNRDAFVVNDSTNYLDSKVNVHNNAERQIEEIVPETTSYLSEVTETYTAIKELETTTMMIEPCPAVPPGLVGNYDLNLTKIPLDIVDNINFGVEHGGHFSPHDCKPKDRVAIIIPYRDRAEHLGMFLNNMHTFLKKQQIEYQIFVVEQKGDGIFNRAILKNIGYFEANKLQDWDCYVFHDVDLLPLNDRILYTCPEQPRHLSAAIDKFLFRLPYAHLCGGVLMMTGEQFKTVNGFSNSYWGWGAEDDDMSNRMKFHNYTLSRYPMSISRYTMLHHQSDKPNPKRYEILRKGRRDSHRDGLLDLNYTIAETQIYNLYTLFLAEFEVPK